MGEKSRCSAGVEGGDIDAFSQTKREPPGNAVSSASIFIVCKIRRQKRDVVVVLEKKMLQMKSESRVS